MLRAVENTGILSGNNEKPFVEPCKVNFTMKGFSTAYKTALWLLVLYPWLFFASCLKTVTEFQARTLSVILIQDLTRIMRDGKYGVKLNAVVRWSSAFHVKFYLKDSVRHASYRCVSAETEDRISIPLHRCAGMDSYSWKHATVYIFCTFCHQKWRDVEFLEVPNGPFSSNATL